MTIRFRLTAWDCLQLLTKRFSDQQVRMVVELDGHLDEVRLAEAIRSAVAAEPVLGCRIQDRFLRPRWTPIAGLDAGSLLPVVPTAEPGSEMNRLLVEDLDPLAGPVVRIGLVRGDRDALVVNLDHTAGDAASVRSLTYLLATLYSHPDRVGAAERGAYAARRGFDALRPLMRGIRGKPADGAAPSAQPSWRFPWRSGSPWAGPARCFSSARRASRMR